MVDVALAKADGTYEPPEETAPRKPRGTAARHTSEDLARTC
jgi:hypothetical protein